MTSSSRSNWHSPSRLTLSLSKQPIVPQIYTHAALDKLRHSVWMIVGCKGQTSSTFRWLSNQFSYDNAISKIWH